MDNLASDHNSMLLLLWFGHFFCTFNPEEVPEACWDFVFSPGAQFFSWQTPAPWIHPNPQASQVFAYRDKVNSQALKCVNNMQHQVFQLVRIESLTWAFTVCMGKRLATRFASNLARPARALSLSLSLFPSLSLSLIVG